MFRSISIVAQIILALAALMIFTTVLSGLLNYLKFEKLVEQQERSRYAFIVDDLRQSIENSLTLGLPLPALRNTGALIERAKAQNAGITAITVFDLAGRRLYDTDSQTKSTVEPSWVAAIDGRPRPAQLTNSTEAAPLFNAFGQRVGGVALRYAPTETMRMTNEIFFQLAKVVLQTALGAVLLTAIGCWLVMRPVRRALVEDAQSLVALDRPDGAVATRGVSSLVMQFESEAVRILQEIETADAAVETTEAAA